MALQGGQLTALLQAAQSADAGTRVQAEQQLNLLQQQNYAELLAALSAELADGSKPVDARRLAGLILKNSLDAKEESRKVRRALEPAEAVITCPLEQLERAWTCNCPGRVVQAGVLAGSTFSRQSGCRCGSVAALGGRTSAACRRCR